MSNLTGFALVLMDWLLAISVVLIAAYAVGGHNRPSTDRRDGRTRVLLFMLLGLFLALIWAKLGAIDVAIAEAAIGAGFAGALLLAAVNEPAPSSERLKPPPGPVIRLLISIGSFAAAILLGVVLWLAFPYIDSARLADISLDRMPETGVSNPVTSVLLNYRAYDTLLEVVVLLAAALGIQQLGPARPAPAAPEPMLAALVPWLVPLLILSAAYLLWVGGQAPGGAFQAGALIAAAGVVLHLSGVKGAGLPSGRWQLLAMVSGIIAFLAVGLATWISDGAFLQYRDGSAGVLILFIEFFAMISISAMLIAAYLGGSLSQSNRKDTH